MLSILWIVAVVIFKPFSAAQNAACPKNGVKIGQTREACALIARSKPNQTSSTSNSITSSSSSGSSCSGSGKPASLHFSLVRASAAQASPQSKQAIRSRSIRASCLSLPSAREEREGKEAQGFLAQPEIVAPPVAVEDGIALAAEIVLLSDAPTPVERAYGRKVGMSDAEIDEEFAKLVLHRADKPGYPAWRWFDRYMEYRKRHPRPKRTVMEAARDLCARIDAQVAAAEARGDVIDGDPPGLKPIFVLRGSDQWRRLVAAGQHRDSQFTMGHGPDCGRITEGWSFMLPAQGEAA